MKEGTFVMLTVLSAILYTAVVLIAILLIGLVLVYSLPVVGDYHGAQT